MHELSILEIILSIAITWIIGLTPPLIIRHVIVKHPLNKWPAVGICAFFLFFNIALFTGMGSQSKTHAALFLVAYVSFWILRKDANSKEAAQQIALTNHSNEDGVTLLMTEAMLGNLNKVQELVRNHADINARDDKGWTPLMYAASRDNYEVVNYLLKAGANSLLKNNKSESATQVALDNGNNEIANLIQKFIQQENNESSIITKDLS